MCSEIYKETSSAFKNINIYPELKDLIMEQIFLCSHVGYDKFLKNTWITKILKWQKESGCFSYNNFNCSSHMTGLGAANLALFGKTNKVF